MDDATWGALISDMNAKQEEILRRIKALDAWQREADKRNSVIFAKAAQLLADMMVMKGGG